jgi:hypothetical protein
MHEVIQIMHVCYTALHYKLKIDDIMKKKKNDILNVILQRLINKLHLRAAKITHCLNTSTAYIKILPPDLDGRLPIAQYKDHHHSHLPVRTSATVALKRPFLVPPNFHYAQ